MDKVATLTYLRGFGNEFYSEAKPNTLPIRGNSPQQVAHNLYAEQLSGSAFVANRHRNLRTWLYRIHPSVCTTEFKPKTHPYLAHYPTERSQTPPTPMRWDPMPAWKHEANFIEGMATFAVNPHAAIHLYNCNQSMNKVFFYNSDGEFLIIPQTGKLFFETEMGKLEVEPEEILVIPRGIKFSVTLKNQQARGYICENYHSPFQLPELGVIGANGLAHPKDFLYPRAHYEEKLGNYRLLSKFNGQLWEASLARSPLDVVAWQGNYAPYKYALNRFNAINTVTYDHPDPSIFTLLTSPSADADMPNTDVVIFPPRWQVADNTFRPPYFHRNIMSEYMGLIRGKYEGKSGQFRAGGSCLHNCMTAHGPDNSTYQQALNAHLTPEYLNQGLAFMLESSKLWQLTSWALNAPFRQQDYLACWDGFKTGNTTN